MDLKRVSLKRSCTHAPMHPSGQAFLPKGLMGLCQNRGPPHGGSGLSVDFLKAGTLYFVPTLTHTPTRRRAHPYNRTQIPSDENQRPSLLPGKKTYQQVTWLSEQQPAQKTSNVYSKNKNHRKQKKKTKKIT